MAESISKNSAADPTVALNRHDREPRAPLLRELPRGGGVREFWRQTLRERKYLLVCFLLPAMLMWLIYISLKVYPFGEESVLVLDLNGQYVYYFEALRDILHGGGSLIYSFCRALGGEFLGIIGYYIASPFSIIPAILPDSMMTESLLIMFLLKTGLCGLTFGIYIDATRKSRNRVLTVIFSTFYALSAFAVVMQHNTMWTDNLIWLPLILLGIENLIKRGKFKMYVITLSLAIFSNFYIGYMMCIFCALYFFFYYYSISPEERNPNGVKFHLPRTLVRFGVFTLLSIAICAVMIWGSYYSLTFGKTDFTNPNFSMTQRFDWLDLASKFYFGSYDTVRPEGWPFVYCGMLTLMLVPLYFFAKKVPLREKLSRLFLCLVIILSFNFNPVDMAWHGFQKPNWLNYRYSFMLIFLLLIMAYKAFEEIREIGFRAVFASGASIAALLMILQKLEYENLPDFRAVWASLALIVGYMLLLRGATMKKPALQKTAAIVMCILVSFEAYAAGLSNLVSLDDDVVMSSRTGYRNFIDKYQPVADRMREIDNSFYRAEKTYHRKTNDNMALGLYGVSNSTSTLNAKIIKVLARYGIASRSHWSKYLGGTEVFDSIFGIRYVLSPEPGSTSDMYEKVDTLEGVGIYYNPYAMSVAAAVSPQLADYDLLSEDSPFEAMNETVTRMLGEQKTVELFKPIEHTSVSEIDANRSLSGRHIKFSKAGDSPSVTITFTAPSDEKVLMYIPAESARECDLYVNSAKKDTYFGNETFRIVDLGAFGEGETVTVKLALQKNDVYLKNSGYYFYTLDRDLFKKTMPRLQSNPFRISEYSDDCLRGTIVVTPGKQLVYTSIPYDEGWHITANGNKVETFEILGGLMAFKLDVGSYNLEFDYMPTCVVYGSAISCTAILAFIAIWIGDALIKKRRTRREALAEYGRVTPDASGDLGLAEIEMTPGRKPAEAEAPVEGKRSVSDALSDARIASELDAEIAAAEAEKNAAKRANSDAPDAADASGTPDAADAADASGTPDAADGEALAADGASDEYDDYPGDSVNDRGDFVGADDGADSDDVDIDGADSCEKDVGGSAGGDEAKGGDSL